MTEETTLTSEESNPRQNTTEETAENVLDPIDVPGRKAIPVHNRKDTSVSSGSNTCVAWGARSDVGLVRGHNEDSFLIQAPLFCVSDGMGGHAAGEVASSIAISSIASANINSADDLLLGAAIEKANLAIISAAEAGEGKPGMGCTASAVYIDKNQMAVAHVGDSRVYLLRAGRLVRVTHDHSYVEELVDAGEITADEARTHPSRSIITRALGSDANMYADHFILDVQKGDRLILCSDGLNSMTQDSSIESIAVSCATPQQAADNLVAEALIQGGHDNVTVIVVDIKDDGQEAIRAEERNKIIRNWALSFAGVLILAATALTIYIRSSWYVATNAEYVGIYQGVKAHFLGIPLSSLDERTDLKVEDLPQDMQKRLSEGINFGRRDEACAAIENYKTQIELEREKAEKISQMARSDSSETEKDTALNQDKNQSIKEGDTDASTRQD